MSIQAQISPLNQNVSSAAVLEVPDKGILTLSESSEVALDINPEAVASYSKSDADLVVQLKNGESIRVANFYAPGQAPSELFLVQEGKLVAVSLPPVAADGVLAATYVAQESVAGFDSLTAAGSAGAGTGATVAGLGMGGMLLAGAAVIGAGVAISNSSGGGGGGGGGGAQPGDTTAPAAASGLQVATDGSSLSGKAEPGATVGVDTNGDGKADTSVVVGADGNFQLPLNPPLTNGQTVTVVVTDPSGNSSSATQTKAPDTTAPAAATNVQVAADGSSVSGKGEPGATAGIDTNGDGKPEVSVVIAPDGTFQIPLTPPLTNGQTVSVVVTDPSGNSSPVAQAKAPDTSAPAPATEVEVATDGTSVSGRGEPGAQVGVDTNGDGQPDVTQVIGADGNFQVPLNPPLTNGQTVTVVITDPAGNSSAGVSVQAPDYPDAPQVNPSNGSVLSGTAEPGITLVITDGDGNPIGQTMADASGNWSFTPSTALADGTVVNVVTEDANGHSSPPASTVIDAVAPNAPLVNPSNGALLSGTAEAGAKIVLSDGDGNPIGQTIADANGNWSFTPGSALPNGAQVNVVAQDAAGNTSGQSSVSVDAIAPAAPTVNPSNGSSLGGTAEANSKVIITDGSGNPIAQVTADGSGNWSYTPGTPIVDGTVIKVLAQDAAGNSSAPATTTVDSSAPSAPIIYPSNGSVISGTTEAGATVTLKDSSGNPIGQVTADGSGHWSFTPSSPLANGTVVVATASDAAGNSATATSIVDSVAPGAPLISPSNGATVSGTAEAAAKVILTDGSGNPIGQVTADGSGNWTFTPASPLPNGTVVNVTATDPAGNTSAPASAIVDAVAPPAPTVNLSNGSTLSGMAEANSKVILTDGSGNPIAEVTANGSGNWSYTPASPIANGTVVNVLSKDAAGNSSAPATVTVDSSAPAAPIINPSNGAVISGSAEAGATVTLTGSGGNPIGQVTADGSGNWSFTPASPLPNGTVVIAKATDPTGNTGPQAATTVDSVAPGAPVISPSNGATVSGTAEAGAKVMLTDSGGSPIGEAIADGSGNWTITPTNPLPNGTVVNAVAQDPAGNSGPPASATVDALPPAAPVVNPSNGNTLNGIAEANSTVTLKDGSGNPIGQVQADAGGNWSFSPGAQLPNGSVVNVTATDAAGNTGAPGSTTIDTSLPSIPHVDPSNGTILSGTADAGNTIILALSNGTPIGQVTVDGSGNWSFSLGMPLPDGTVVTVIARNPTGTDSAAAVATIDGVAPGAPVIAASNGAELSGSAEAGATIILTDGGGNPIGQTTANGSGQWSFTPGSPLPNGTVVNAVAKDAAGNTSGPVSTTVDALAPSVPFINASTGVVITGTAEIGAKVILTDGSGNPIGETTANGSGVWSFTPGAPLANGTVVNAVARDAAGNTSGPISTTVDSVAPAAPVINPVNGTLVTGTAEAGATIILKYSSGNPIGEVTADGSGNWSFLPGVGSLPHGQVFTAVAKDAAGNTSAPTTATVDAMPPAAPVVNPTNGSVLAGTAEAGAKVTLTDGSGNPIGQVNADGSGNWSFTPASPLPNGTVVNAVAQDLAGNNSGPGSTTVDSQAPAAPVINASNGAVISGTAEIGAKITLTDGSGNPIGQTTANGSGNWSFTPGSPLANGTVVNAVAEDAAGNDSPPASTTVDSVAPPAPVLNISADGALLSGTAEANSQVRIVINGDSANPITVNVNGSGNFSLPLAPPLIAGQPVSAVAVDAAGNLSGPSSVTAPDLAPPTLSVAEAADTWINAAEIANGIQVSVTVRPTLQVGQVITVNFAGQNGYQVQASHTLTAGDITAGTVSVTLNPSGGPFPQGASTITADINGGTASTPVAFTIDTVPPATPVLSLVGNLLTISTDPGTELTVTLTVGGVTGTVTVTADNSGLASLNLLTDLDIDFSWDQLLSAQVSVVGRDPAGNPSSVASIAIGTNIEQPVTIGGFAVDVSLNPLNPRFGFSGNTEVGSSLLIRVITPALDVQLLPILADGSGHFALNLLSPTILTQLGLNITDILNLGSQISFNVIATDSQGNDSAAYGITLLPNGLSSIIGQINVNGTAGDDVMSAVNGSAEHLNGGDGSDLIFNVGAGDHVAAGNGNDTIQITATNFVSIDGGAGFDTLLLANGIDLDYNAVGVGTLSNIERVDLGKGDAGSVLTLTAAEVGLITDANNTLQITGESNDTLNVVGALNTGTTQTINGLVYDVYAFGVNTLLVEENTVQVVV
ncbi:BapA prefix-like domain-containing protein [Pseudomonas tructae]|uniref:BapA prefix-like domain-containing protein n=1 Tax=Pseudomonas tructae TaxID=2518644 RepID=A0A411MJ46_9PSED|nr:Ig-like domain-containing protein [Pseudomonas tructae]QBF26811.1 BapA prefix-like domain-containing protein [Pseudomonas tructae]